MWELFSALAASLPAALFAWIYWKQRDNDSYEDRLEKERDELLSENLRLKHEVDDAKNEVLRLMQKLLKNGGT